MKFFAMNPLICFFALLSLICAEYTAEVATVTTPLSYHFEYSESASSSLVMQASTYTFGPAATLGPINLNLMSWYTTDSATSYTYYIFYEFVDNLDTVTDIKFYTNTTATDNRLTATPSFIVNLEEGAYGIIKADNSNPQTDDFGIAITYNNSIYTYCSRSCDAQDSSVVKNIAFYFDECFKWPEIGPYGPWATTITEDFTTDIIYRMSSSASLATTSSSYISTLKTRSDSIMSSSPTFSSSSSAFLSLSSSSTSSTATSYCADSEPFYLELQSNGTEFEDCNVWVGSDYKIYVSNVTSELEGMILANTSLFDVEYYHIMGIGKNYLSEVSYSESYIVADPWTIEDGYLKLYGKDFHVVESGQRDVWVLGSANAIGSSADGPSEVKIKARLNDGEYLSTFPTSCITGTTTESLPTASSTLSSSSSTVYPIASTHSVLTTTVTTKMSYTTTYYPDLDNHINGYGSLVPAAHYPKATNNPVDLDFQVWDASVEGYYVNSTLYHSTRVWSFFRFTEDFEADDIAVIINNNISSNDDSYFYEDPIFVTNLREGAYVIINTTNVDFGGEQYLLVITKDNVTYGYDVEDCSGNGVWFNTDYCLGGLYYSDSNSTLYSYDSSAVLEFEFYDSNSSASLSESSSISPPISSSEASSRSSSISSSISPSVSPSESSSRSSSKLSSISPSISPSESSSRSSSISSSISPSVSPSESPSISPSESSSRSSSKLSSISPSISPSESSSRSSSISSSISPSVSPSESPSISPSESSSRSSSISSSISPSEILTNSLSENSTSFSVKNLTVSSEMLTLSSSYPIAPTFSSSPRSNKSARTGLLSDVTTLRTMTTVITISSCSSNICTEVPLTTGAVVVTTSMTGFVTQYTTFCPLSGFSASDREITFNDSQLGGSGVSKEITTSGRAESEFCESTTSGVLIITTGRENTNAIDLTKSTKTTKTTESAGTTRNTSSKTSSDAMFSPITSSSLDGRNEPNTKSTRESSTSTSAEAVVAVSTYSAGGSKMIRCVSGLAGLLWLMLI